MGLGLSVSRSLIEALGGRIEVQTTAQKGSQFIVHLPCEEGIVGDHDEQPQVMAEEDHG